MTTIDQVSQAARRLTADEIRARLDEIDREARLLRALLRAALRDAQKPAAKGVARD